MWNRKKNQVRKTEGGRGTRTSRRGVLLLVVLSMLVLFMLVGTAFLMSSNQSRVSMKKVALQDRVGNYATRLLDRALFQVVRDTDNQYSVIRYHSLLRDLYGTDGFQSVAYRPGTVDLALLEGQATRFAGAIADDASTSVREDLGPTNGQFIDIYVLTKPYTPIDYSTRYNGLANPLDLRCVLKLERNPYGELQPYTLPLTKGYFNGCLLTMTSGPASGQSTRILDYEYIGERTKAVANKFTAERLFRFRVMAIQRTDGQSIQPDPSAAAKARSPELGDLAAQSFVVNGRAFSGTGVGYNPLAVTGQPRLSALQLYPYPFGTPSPTTFIGAELALLPNSVYFNPLTTPVGAAPFTVPNPDASKPPILVDPFLMPLQVGTLFQNRFQPLNTVTAAAASSFSYPSFDGIGGSNESYDAPDFQNIGLASLTVKPRSQARVVTDQPPYYYSMEDFLADPGSKGKFLRLDLEDVPLPSFHRPDLVNYWYHRLVRYLKDLRGMDENDAVRSILRPYEDDKFKTNSIVPQLKPEDAALISAIKRQIMLRPTNEDHPHFDGGNALSVQPINAMVANNLVSTDKTQITLPYWAACGPWDVDNDNDGVRDSIWVDLGDPIQETEDGRRYKPLYAFLCVDLDSRLNVNAHGLVDDILPPLDGAGKNLDSARTPFFDTTFLTDLAGTPGNLAHTPTTVRSTLQLPRGLGYGPAEISLRPVFPAPWNSSFQPTFGNQDESGPVDSYATLLTGRKDANGKAIVGRNGFNVNSNFLVKSQEAEPGTNYTYVPIVTSGPGSEPAGSPRWYTGEKAAPDLAAQLMFFNYPWSFTHPSAFGIVPDLKGRYALGLDYAGQPNYEVARDVNPNTATAAPANQLPFNLLANTPYEMDLSSPQRRDSWASHTNAFGSMVDPVASFQTSLGQNDDAPFSPTDLEKVLRGWDLDASTLPSRLWDVVDSFDPYKLCWFDPYRVKSYANDLFDPVSRSIPEALPYQTPSPQLLTAAQELAGISRRSVTTDSFSLPVATEDFRKKLIYGADGLPGLPGVDDAPTNGIVDDVSELNTVPFMNGTVMTGTDDYKVVMQEVRNRTSSTTFGLTVPNNPRILDYLRYRIVLELLRRNVIKTGVTMTDDQIDAGINNIIYAGGLLSPETISGLRMDLNRPFGDGQDNNGDGVVDDPLEAGEPFVDVNANGKWDLGEPWIDFDGNKQYTAPVDQLWSTLTANGAIAEKVAFDYSNGQVVPLYPGEVAALSRPVLGGVRNLESQGRQLYARQLYCLMLLLTDENYIAPWDPNDAQLIAWMDTERKKLTDAPTSMPWPAADLLVKRKATCRTIAQWAINCADMRDSDAIQTPFEYDENPWDGWGVLEQDGNLIPIDGDVATDENKGEMIDWARVPQGRDTTTAVDDNSKVIAPSPAIGTLAAVPSLVPAAKLPTVENQTRGVVWGAERPDLLITETLAFHDRRCDDDFSNDSDGHGEMKNYGKDRDPKGPPPPPGSAKNYYRDSDPDQGLRARGSLFAEVYNPWSADGQYPAEIYSRLVRDPNNVGPVKIEPSKGVELGRVSTIGVDLNGRLSNLIDPVSATTVTVKRSPVWRMIVVEEWPDSRNSDTVDNFRLDKLDPGTCLIDPVTGVIKPNSGKPYTFPAPKEALPYQDTAATVKTWSPSAAAPNSPFRPTDPDFDPLFGADTLQLETTVPASPLTKVKTTYLVNPAFGNAGRLPKQLGTTNSATNLPDFAGNPTNQFYVAYPSIEREFYFTTDKSPIVNALPKDYEQLPSYNFSPSTFRLRIPDRSIAIRYPNPSGTGAANPKAGQTQKFIPWQLERASLSEPSIAPILPGRYGVIGSAGTNYHYDATAPLNPNSQVYTTTVGRLKLSSILGGFNTDDLVHNPANTRRIELHPSKDPNQQQLLVASNGGDPADDYTGIETKQYDPTTPAIGRDNELINDNGTIKNIYDSKPGNDGTLTGTPNSRYYQPCVSIPVEGMNISEPAWGYAAREYEAMAEELAIKGGSSKPNPLIYEVRPGSKNYEGRYYETFGGSKTPYDKPFDGFKEHPIAPELMRTGTTPNYRTIHLQRLANPILPWNPDPKLINGEPNPEYMPNLPINPYRTVDSASVNLTAFNGVSDAEAEYDTVGRPLQQAEMLQMRPWILPEVTKSTGGYLIPNFVNGLQVWFFRSLERGTWSRLNLLGSNVTPPAVPTSPPQRVLWSQEPAMVKFKKDGFSIFDLMTARQVTMRASEIPNEVPRKIKTDQNILPHRVEMVLEHTLGFGNESFGLLYDAQNTKVTRPTDLAIGSPAPGKFTWKNDSTSSTPPEVQIDVNSTNPWLAWENRPYVSPEELLKVPGASQSQMLRQYTTIDTNVAAADRPNPYGLASTQAQPDKPPTPGSIQAPAKNLSRWAALQAPFGSLTQVFATTAVQPIGTGGVPMLWYVQGIADVVRDATGVPIVFDDKTGAVVDPKTLPDRTKRPNIKPYGAPNFNRILEYVQVPSRYVGTETMLNAETFNDDRTLTSGPANPYEDIFALIPGAPLPAVPVPTLDPRYYFQPPFNKVSRERDPGRVNLNTVTGRRTPPPVSGGAAQIWSEVYDGIMHRFHDGDLKSQNQLGHFGPAWRDVVLSRRGYAQVDAAGNSVDKPPPPPIGSNPNQYPDTFEFGLNSNFPTVFANPFRSPDAGDLVPLVQMMQYGADASMLRVHPYVRGTDKKWGAVVPPALPFGDARDAGFGDDTLSIHNVNTNGPTWTIPSDDVTKRDTLPLFSEAREQPFADTDRNPYMMYEPMSRLGNLVTNRSGVYAVWITVGYFEVEKAPDWSDTNVQQHFGNDINLYNRAYPDGYMLGKELGSETGDVKRPRGFYIIDRTEEVGFKPGEDLNVEKTIRLRRRIE